jgi:type IX secretion system PorP/SprF family membrane protein
MLYAENPYLVNPATAGLQYEGIQAALLYRRQFANIPGAPETQLLTVEGNAYNRRVGLGLQVFNDVDNILGRTSAMLTYAYHLPLSQTQRLSFGLSGGIRSNRIYFERVQGDRSDEDLLTINENRTSVDASFGLQYQWKSLKAGLASYQLLGNDLTFSSESEFKAIQYQLIRHYAGFLEYTFNLPQHSLNITPMAAGRSAQGLPVQGDFGAMVTWKENYWVMPMHRTGSGINLAAGLKVTDNINLSYGYEFYRTNLAELSGGSHEVMLRFRFGNKKAVVANNQNSEDFGQMQHQVAEQYETIDQLSEQNEQLKEEVAESRRRIDAQQKEIDRLKSIATVDDAGIKELKKRLEDLDESEKLDTEVYNYFVVVSAFKELKNAKEQQQLFRRHAKLNTKVVYSEKYKYYLIYTKNIQSVEEGLEEADNLKTGKVNDMMVGNPWVFIQNK